MAAVPGVPARSTSVRSDGVAGEAVKPEPPKRWPFPPPKGQRCDATVPAPPDAPDTRGHPTIYTCRQRAVETLCSLTSSRMFREVWLCAEHVEAYVERGYAYRNPRKFPAPKEWTD